MNMRGSTCKVLWMSRVRLLMMLRLYMTWLLEMLTRRMLWWMCRVR